MTMAHVDACAMAYMWRLKDNSVDSVLSFYLSWVIGLKPDEPFHSPRKRYFKKKILPSSNRLIL